MKIFEQSRQALSKNLIRPLPVQYLEDGGSGDCSPDRRCTSALGMVQTTKAVQQQEGGKTLTRVGLILMKAKPTSRQNRLGLGFRFPQT